MKLGQTAAKKSVKISGELFEALREKASKDLRTVNMHLEAILEEYLGVSEQPETNQTKETEEKLEEGEWFEVTSDAIAHFNIFTGDDVHVQKTKEWNENSLYVWETPDGQIIRLAYENFDDITLHNKNGWIKRYPKKKVKLIGEVTGVYKKIETEEKEEIEPEQITLVCDGCEVKIKGTREFIKGMGWQLGENSGRKPLCLNCDLD